MSNPSQSALLQCLSCLDVDIWAQVLLPKLVAQGSARDVALTCSQLRDLCYGAVRHINLSSVHDSSGTNSSVVEDWAQGLPRHFKNITSVQLLLVDEASYHTTPYLLPALARLPKLDLVKLQVKGDPRPLAMGTVLYSLRTQLPASVRSLHLDLQQSWAGAAQAWGQLGKLTALTQLVLDFDEVPEPLGEQDLLPLADLQSLEHLVIVSASQTSCQPLLSAQLAGGLTALSYLAMDACRVSSFAHVSSCTSLRVLKMGCPSGSDEELGPSEWAAVGKLTGLVELALHNAKLLTPTPECLSAISQLTRLQSFGAWKWSARVLPALAACTQLTKLSGGLQQDDNGTAGFIALPGVVKLRATYGSPPFAALPNLTSVEQYGCLSADAFTGMARHCTGLRELSVVERPLEMNSLNSNEPSHARIAAVKALSALTNLTRLDFMVGMSVELVALVGVVGALLPHGFHHLNVVVHGDMPLPLSALMHLAKLQGLPELLLQVNAGTEMVQHAANFLGALSGVCAVRIMGLKSEQVAALAAAQAGLEEMGLPRPSDLYIDILPPAWLG